MRAWQGVFLAPLLCSWLVPAEAADGDDKGPSIAPTAERLVSDAIHAVCDPRVKGIMPGARVTKEEPLRRGHETVGRTLHLALPNGGVIKLHQVMPTGRLQKVVADYYEPTARGRRASLSAGGDRECRLREGRRIVYDARGGPYALQYLDGGLKDLPRRDLLNPEVPPGQDNGGVRVAVVDSGVNYLLPEVAAALARDSGGKALGYDFWDMDDRPFDGDPLRSPFDPQRHGTLVSGVILEADASISLVPYRYPGPAPDRIAEIIDDFVAKGVRIVNISLGSPQENRWQVFYQAAKKYSDVLFVLAAGNDGKNLDQNPIYPVSYRLDNTISVAALGRDGHLAGFSNWGPATVDLAAQGEDVPAINFDGKHVKVKGTSYAAPLVSVFAARLLKEHPNWGAVELKKEIVSRCVADTAGRQTRFGELLLR